jgi:hypothetical protein
MRKTRRKKPMMRLAGPGKRRASLVAVALALTGAIAAAIILFRAGAPPGAGSAPMSPAVQEARAPAITLAADSDFGRLKGRWLRPDGGYVLEIRDVDAGGTIEAAYLNPRPINVARAEATRNGSTVKVLVELRAPGYPGSTYTLTYDQPRDQLVGVYFQAAVGQSFDVVFVRLK